MTFFFFPVNRSHLPDFLHLRNFYLILNLVFPFYTQLGFRTSCLQGLYETPLNFFSIFCGAAQSNI